MEHTGALSFWKCEGSENDFVVVVDLDDEIELSAAQIRGLCARRRGVGADGVIRILRGRSGGDLQMEHRNADGSLSLMCGNGARVVGRLAAHLGITGEELSLETPRGVRGVRVSETSVTVEMGGALLGAVRDHRLGRVRSVEVGNAHLVVEVDSLDTLDTLEGRDGVNVEYVEVIDSTHLRMRVRETGVGETRSCGSGAVAAAAGVCTERSLAAGVEVEVPGGVLSVRGETHALTLEGAAHVVCTGVVTAGALAQWAQIPQP